MTPPTPEDFARGRQVTFARVVRHDGRRLVVDVCGVALAFSTRDGRALSPLGRAYELLATLPVVGDGQGQAALHWAPPTRRRSRRAPADRRALSGQAEDTGP